MASANAHFSIQLQDVCKGYATRSLFEAVCLAIGPASRIGLIGPNGCGKSTLLKLIMNAEEPDSGTIYRSPGVRVHYLSQEPKITPHWTLEAEMRSVFTRLNQLTQEEAALSHALACEPHTEARALALARQLGAVQQEMEQLDARHLDARIGRILKGLGFSQADHHRQTGEFSGGWQMRINLAKVLLNPSDVLLLDEPTNHLDMAACEWLEQFLQGYPGGLVIVSHDRQFLDQTTTETADLAHGGLTLWAGNYTHAQAQKAAAHEQRMAAYERQQKELAQQTAFIERFRASATRSTQAKSREKQLAKIQRIQAPQGESRPMAMRFPTPRPSGKEVLTLSRVSKSFGDRRLFATLNGTLLRQKRVFLLGANGCGKTTLLKLLMGLEAPDSGCIQHGYHVQLGYFSQNQLDTLNPESTALESLQAACPTLTQTELRTLLGCFLLSGEAVFKPVGILSGGEKSKLALAQLMMSGANTLLLDEPTNHMDIPSRDVIAEALLAYEGTLLCISHDRYFIRQLATEIWEIDGGQLLRYPGDYAYYRAMRAQRQESEPPAKPQKPAPAPEASLPASADREATAPNRKRLQKELNALESRIIRLESELGTLSERLQDPAIQADYDTLQQTGAAIQRTQETLDALNAQWEGLADALGA